MANGNANSIIGTSKKNACVHTGIAMQAYARMHTHARSREPAAHQGHNPCNVGADTDEQVVLAACERTRGGNTTEQLAGNADVRRQQLGPMPVVRRRVL